MNTDHLAVAFFPGKEYAVSRRRKRAGLHLACLNPGAGGVHYPRAPLFQHVFQRGTYAVGPDNHRNTIKALRQPGLVKNLHALPLQTFQNLGIMYQGPHGTDPAAGTKFPFGHKHRPADPHAETKYLSADYFHKNQE
jgi:hypothetical protein